MQLPNGVTLIDIIAANTDISVDQLPGGDIFKMQGASSTVIVPTTGPETSSSTSSVTVYALSKGFNDGNEAGIEINGKSVFGTAAGFPHYAARGMNVAVIDEVSGRALSVRLFDTYDSRDANTELHDHILNIPNGRIVAIVVRDEASRYLDSKTRLSITLRLKAKRIIALGHRDSRCLVTRVGYSDELLHEAFSKRFSGGVEIKTEALKLPLGTAS